MTKFSRFSWDKGYHLGVFVFCEETSCCFTTGSNVVSFVTCCIPFRFWEVQRWIQGGGLKLLSKIQVRLYMDIFSMVWDWIIQCYCHRKEKDGPRWLKGSIVHLVTYLWHWCTLTSLKERVLELVHDHWVCFCRSTWIEGTDSANVLWSEWNSNSISNKRGIWPLSRYSLFIALLLVRKMLTLWKYSWWKWHIIATLFYSSN